jgi:nucleotide-binding universal stress UspA family protein
MAQGIFHHILAPVDGSGPAIEAGRFAIKLAALYETRITFVYVVDTVLVDELMAVSRKPAEQIRQDLEITGQRYLDHLARLAAEAQLEVDQVIRHGTPYLEITRLAGEQGVDLIVIAQVGRRGPPRILVGSVTERVLEYAPCPVLVVK